MALEEGSLECCAWQGYGIVKEMEDVKTEGDVPVEEVLIADCGELPPEADKSAANGHVRFSLPSAH